VKAKFDFNFYISVLSFNFRQFRCRLDILDFFPFFYFLLSFSYFFYFVFTFFSFLFFSKKWEKMTIFEKFASWSIWRFSVSPELKLSTNETLIYTPNVLSLRITKSRADNYQIEKEMSFGTHVRCAPRIWITTRSVFWTGGKPSTWFPPERLVKRTQVIQHWTPILTSHKALLSNFRFWHFFFILSFQFSKTFQFCRDT